jgi:hypothetical protein
MTTGSFSHGCPATRSARPQIDQKPMEPFACWTATSRTDIWSDAILSPLADTESLIRNHPVAAGFSRSRATEVAAYPSNMGPCFRLRHHAVWCRRDGREMDAADSSSFGLTARSVCHALEQARRGLVAFARRRFELFTVHNGDAATVIRNESGPL